MKRRLELLLRLAFAWTKAKRAHVRRSVAGRYRKPGVRKPKPEATV